MIRKVRIRLEKLRQGRLRSRLEVESLEERCLLSADMVVQWNNIALQASVNDYSLPPGEQIGPTRLGRAMAIVHAAIYDSVNSISPQYTPYLTQVVPAAGASMDAAVAQAACDTLNAMFPNQQGYFQNQLTSSLQPIPAQARADGVAVGDAVANAILTARSNDNSQIYANGNSGPTYMYQQGPGKWQADPLHSSATPLTPLWGSVTPFVMQSETQFFPPAPPALNSQVYAQAYMVTKLIGQDNSAFRTPEQTDIGIFWGYDAQPQLCAPVRFYNQIAQVIAQQEGNTEVQNARMFALINLALADAGINCWGAKYDFDLWRPITAIRENDPGSVPNYPGGWPGSGNPLLVGQGDPNWAPWGAPAHNGGGNFTPPFPTYTSGHGTFGGALFKLMEDFYGTDKITFTIMTDEFNTVMPGNLPPLTPQTYSSFSQAAGENALSRIFLGIHYTFDAYAAIHSGNQIADYVYTHALIPLHGPKPVTLPSMGPEARLSSPCNVKALHHSKRLHK
jgi:hypothetical protein